MPELRLQKARESLPIGYQFGDAGREFAIRAPRFESGRHNHLVVTPEWLKRDFCQKIAAVDISEFSRPCR